MEDKRGFLGKVFILFGVLFLIGAIVYVSYVVFFPDSIEVSIKIQKIDNPIEAIKARLISLQENKIENINIENLSPLNSSLNLSSDSSPDNNSLYNESELINEAMAEFNESYINYILYAIGVEQLHSAVGFGNPELWVVVDGETWRSEIVNGNPVTMKIGVEEPDIILRIGKEEAVKSLLASDMKIFMKESVKNGRTGIEMIAGNMELAAKGYLGLYNNLAS